MVVGRKTPLSLVETLLPTNQEMMSENDQSHVMVPSAPEAEFVVVHDQFPFAFGKTGLDGPAHPTHAHKRGQWRLWGSIAQVKFPFRLLCRTADFAPDHNPDFRAWQPIQRQDGAQHKKIGDQRAFVSLKPPKAVPGRRRPLFGEVLQRHFRRTARMQSLSPRCRPLARGNLRVNPTARTRSLRLPVRFEKRPDFGIARHLGQIP